MLTVAYLANQFPASVEPYVSEEIDELRRRGVCVIAGSVWKPNLSSLTRSSDFEVLCLQFLRAQAMARAIWLLLWRWRNISDLLARVLFRGKESPKRRLKALLHTVLGAYYAALLEGRGVAHIHVHHGYFASWIAMVAARLLGIPFSLTLHGSDLLLDAAFLDTKLNNCLFCVTISTYNRCYILRHVPEISGAKIIVSRLGVAVPESIQPAKPITSGKKLSLLAVGRLHPVKDHAFLVRACSHLRDFRVDFHCTIVGEGPERKRLEGLIRESQLQDHVTLAGYAACDQVDLFLRNSDVLVLTSRSEGLPLVLMEAMARGKIVLAPAITGIPEIIIPEKTGFLYAPGLLDDCLTKVLFVRELLLAESCFGDTRLKWIRHAARLQVLHNFNRTKNLAHFAGDFLHRLAPLESGQSSSPSLPRIPPGRISAVDCVQHSLERPA